MSTFAERLKSARLAAKLSQAAAAKKAGMSQPNLSELENGKYPSSSFVPMLASIYGVSALWLSTNKGPRKPDEKTASSAPTQSIDPSPDAILKAVESLLAAFNVPMSTLIPDAKLARERLSDALSTQKTTPLPEDWGVPNTGTAYGFSVDDHGTDRIEVDPLLDQDIQSIDEHRKNKGQL